MSTQRLTFLYPHLFRTARLGEPAATANASRSRSAFRCRRLRPATTPATIHHAAPFNTSTSSGKGSFAPRSGKAIEPKPLGDVQKAPALESHMQSQDAPPTEANNPPSSSPEARDSTPDQREAAAKALDPSADPIKVKETLSSPGVSSEEKKQKQRQKDDALAAHTAATDAAEEIAAEAAEKEDVAAGKKKRPASNGPMDAVLHMGPPEDVPPEEKPPHLTPPPYVHHFDSYSLVKQLEGGGWTNEQAITAMKAVRGLLAQNLDVAQGGLIGKSDVENETYLFRAACAELSTEVRNNRRIAEEQLRQQRTVLQHEVDNTTQVMNQELLTLNDNVKGMFNDRKMTVREEQKALESTTQQIAYKISVTLNSDSKSQIEAVRWVLARRAVLGIAFMVTLSLAMLRLGSYFSQESKREAQRVKEESEALRKSGGKIDGAHGPDAAEILAAN